MEERSSSPQSRKEDVLDDTDTPSTPAQRRRSSRRSLKFYDGSPENEAIANPPPSDDAYILVSSSKTLTAPKSMASLIGSASTASGPPSAKRLYRASGGDSKKYVTRDIAALDFLLGIPLAAEATLVRTGWRLQRKQFEEDVHDYSDTDYASGPLSPDSALKPASDAASHGTWWEKYVRSFTASVDALPSKQQQEGGELERPTTSSSAIIRATRTASGMLLPAYTPGRRLDGDVAIHIQIPLTADETMTRQKSIARTAAIREWERKTARGILPTGDLQPPLLDGRLFFSASGSYPVSVFSMVRYEPRREQAEFRRKKLESLGGGGSQFIMPTRDWRGISYRALLSRRHDKSRRISNSYFNRFVSGPSSSTGATGDKNKSAPDDDGADDASSFSSESLEDSDDVYVPGLLDDPDMTHGRHHNVMIGDHVTGPIVSSTIQFVKPAILKAELNKQFRERFDGWEPPKEARKYIGAFVSVPEGKYVLKDPTTDDTTDYASRTRTRQESVTSMSSASGEGGHKEKTSSTLRIPPSLTLSKIRSLKQQALRAAVKARLEIGTVALAYVYFERLCLDCRVDKSNRRLAFAACLLLACKINEPNVRLVMQQEDDDDNDKSSSRFQSLIRPNKRGTKMYASLLEFFTESWSLSVKTLFDAEWGVFAALGFSLHATPSQVAFHYRRLMKTLEWSPRDYLGKQMWTQWQDALKEEERRKRERERRREVERKKKEEKLLNLQLELENEVLRRQNADVSAESEKPSRDSGRDQQPAAVAKDRGKKSGGGIKLFNRFGTRRSHSAERSPLLGSASDHPSINRSGTPMSSFPSMPVLSHRSAHAVISGVVAIEIPDGGESETSSIRVIEGSNNDDQIV